MKPKNKIMIMMSRLMIACDEASYLLSYRQDHKLGIVRWWNLQLHLLTCHLCRKYARQLSQLQKAMDAYAHRCDGTCTHHLPGDSKVKLRDVLDGETNAK